jgi:hypothetical protein
MFLELPTCRWQRRCSVGNRATHLNVCRAPNCLQRAQLPLAGQDSLDVLCLGNLCVDVVYEVHRSSILHPAIVMSATPWHGISLTGTMPPA